MAGNKKKKLDVEFVFRRESSLGSFRILIVFMVGVVMGLTMSSTLSRMRLYPSGRPYKDAVLPTAVQIANCDKEGFVSKKNLVSSLSPRMMMNHTMTDEELLFRGSMMPVVDERVTKVAFMFMVRGPLPLRELWDRFFRGHERFFSVYVHTAPGFRLDVPRNSSFHGRQVPSKEVKWGTITMIDAERRLLANALLDPNNERFVLLSETCIPLFNFPTIRTYLLGSALSFVDSFDDDSYVGRGRYNNSMSPDVKLEDWRKGSEWFEMGRKVATAIVAEQKIYSIFKHHCKLHCYSDEHYFPTYLHMFHGAWNANRTVTWVDWARGGGPHPATYGRSDVSEGLIQSIRSNWTTCNYNDRPTSMCYLFARKFAPSALEPLLNMASRVMKY